MARLLVGDACILWCCQLLSITVFICRYIQFLGLGMLCLRGAATR